MPRLKKNVTVADAPKKRRGRPPGKTPQVAVPLSATAVQVVPGGRRIKQVWNLADDVKVTMEYWSNDLPDYNARQNFVVIATGTAKGGVLPDAMSATPFAGSMHGRVGGEESRTNITNMSGFNMTRGTMDPVEALNGIPGLTAEQKAVARTLENVEASVIDRELGNIPDEDLDAVMEEMPS